MAKQFIPQINGTDSAAVIHEEAMRSLARRARTVYEAHEFTLNNGEVNSSIKTVINHVTSCSCARGAFTLIGSALRLLVRNTGAAQIQIRLNGITGDHDEYTVFAGETQDFNMVEFDDIFLTNDIDGVNTTLSVVMA